MKRSPIARHAAPLVATLATLAAAPLSQAANIVAAWDINSGTSPTQPGYVGSNNIGSIPPFLRG